MNKNDYYNNCIINERPTNAQEVNQKDDTTQKLNCLIKLSFILALIMSLAIIIIFILILKIENQESLDNNPKEEFNNTVKENFL